MPDSISDVLRFETDLAFLIGRTQLLGASDLPALEDVMTVVANTCVALPNGEPRA